MKNILMDRYRFTVWTPSYNRALYLQRAYESLISQTYKNFEWIIIDDGSTDNTQAVVERFILDSLLPSIKYIKKNNGGKHTAWQAFMDVVNSDYVVTLDSDDTLTSDALSVFDKYWSQLESSNEYTNFWEVKARVQDQYGKMVGNQLPRKIFDSTTGELVFKYRIKAEMEACRRTDVLQNEAKVPEDFLFREHCSNFPEGIRWLRAGKVYKSRYVDEIVRTYYRDAPDKLITSNKNSRSVKRTYNNLIGAKYLIEENWHMMMHWDKKAYLVSVVILLYTSFCLDKNPFRVLATARKLDNFLLFLFYVPVFIFYMIRK